MAIEARERLIVALDVPSVAKAEAMVTRLGDSVRFYKIGYQLAFAGGIPFAAKLVAPASRFSSISSCTISATRSPKGSRASLNSAQRFSRCMPIRKQ